MSQNQKIVRKTINLLNTSDTIDDPQLSLLIEDGWKVFCSVAIEQEGKPTLVLYLSKDIKSNEILIKKTYLDYTNFIFIFVVCLYILIMNIL